MKKRVAVLGATGIVGQRFVSLLNEHPYFEVTSLYASKNSAGKKYKDAVNWVIEPPLPSYAKDVVLKSFDERVEEDIVFSALPKEVADTLEIDLAKEGKFVFSNTASHRFDPFVPILIPEVNPHHIEAVKYQKTEGFIITNANCSTTGLVIPLKALMEKFTVKSVFVVTMQAISGAGINGLSALLIQGNVLPYIEKEEEKIESETRKILGEFKDGFILKSLPVFARANRVPVREGHTEVVFVETDADCEDAKLAFKNFVGIPQEISLPTAPEKPILLHEEMFRPQPVLDVNSGKGMSVSVGRIRKNNGFLTFTLLSHNTIRGAAGGSVLNAEFALKEGFI